MNDNDIFKRLEAFDKFHSADINVNWSNKDSVDPDIVFDALSNAINSKKLYISPHVRHSKCLKTNDCDCIEEEYCPIVRCSFDQLSNCKCLFEFFIRQSKVKLNGWYMFSLDDEDNEEPICIYTKSKRDSEVGYIEVWLIDLDKTWKIPVTNVSQSNGSHSYTLSLFDTR